MIGCIAHVKLHFYYPHVYHHVYYRREFDVQRRLVRAECKVTQYSNQGERKVASVFVVAEHVARLIPRSVAVFVDPVDISGS